MGPYRNVTYHGYHYLLTVVDDYSISTLIHLIKHKGDYVDILAHFVSFLENKF